MATNVFNYDGTLRATIPDTTIDQSTSISLPGYRYVNYAEPVDQDLLWIMQNFASATEPTRPVKGQNWYNTATQQFLIFNGTTWQAIGVTSFNGEIGAVVLSAANVTAALGYTSPSTVITIPGEYEKVVVNSNGLVTSGNVLVASDITGPLGFTPPAMITTIPGVYEKVDVNSNGLVISGSMLDYTDISNALNFFPQNAGTNNLQTVTNVGAVTNLPISITNTTPSSSTSTGAFVVSGGIGVGGNVTAAIIESISGVYSTGNIATTANMSATGGIGASSFTTTPGGSISAGTGGIATTGSISAAVGIGAPNFTTTGSGYVSAGTGGISTTGGIAATGGITAGVAGISSAGGISAGGGIAATGGITAGVAGISSAGGISAGAGGISSAGSIGTNTTLTCLDLQVNRNGTLDGNFNLPYGTVTAVDITATNTVTGNYVRAGQGASGSGDPNRCVILNDFTHYNGGAFAGQTAVVFPDGTIIQGNSGGTSGDDTYTFPIAFPNTCSAVMMCEANSGDQWKAGSPTLYGVYNRTNYGFNFVTLAWNGYGWNVAGGTAVMWFAIGY